MTNPYAAPGAPMSEVESETYHPNFFSLKGRLGRVRYLCYGSCGYFGIAMVFGAMIASFTGALKGSEHTASLVISITVLMYLIIFIMGVILAVRRLNDLDQTGWLTLVFLIPLVNLFFGLYLLFAPGTPRRNLYGPPTVPNTTGTVLGALVFPVLVAIGILAAIALPAYQSYRNKAKAAEQTIQLAPSQVPAPAASN
jgi:uncharacterized membrane protein YhaH (DUF805 family)